MCNEMVTGDNVQHARSCGMSSMVQPSQHLQPVLMKNDRSHPHRSFVSHTFDTLRFSFALWRMFKSHSRPSKAELMESVHVATCLHVKRLRHHRGL